MTDRERALEIAWSHVVMKGHPTFGDWQNLIADVMLEFAANEVETCATDPTFRAEELRAQIGGKSDA